MATNFLPRKLRASSTEDAQEPSWLKRRVTPILQAVSGHACRHPIHTIVVVALLASTTYVGLLEGSLFEATSRNNGQLDVDSLLAGGRNLRLGERTAWRWQVEDGKTVEGNEVCAGDSVAGIGWILMQYYSRFLSILP